MHYDLKTKPSNNINVEIKNQGRELERRITYFQNLKSNSKHWLVILFLFEGSRRKFFLDMAHIPEKA